MQKLTLAAALLCTTFATSQAMAWDGAGHKIVALVAEHYLTPQTKDRVRSLLAGDNDKLTDHDLASASTWADKYADSDKATTHQRYDQTNEWHFARLAANRPNVPEACYGQKPLPTGTQASRGPAKSCVIDKINDFADELANVDTPEAERLLALKYLLNLVGDIHQPLRVTDEGNDYGQHMGIKANAMTPGDLFTVWDSIVVSRLQGTNSPEQTARLLIARISEEDRRLWASRAPQLWALEAHQLGVIYAYGMTGNFDDQGYSNVDDAKMDQATKLAALQLSRAGVRLAYMLNQAIAPNSLPPVATSIPSAGSAVAGEAFARVVCTVCHVVSKDQKIATTAPDFAAIAKTRGITESALHEFLSGPHPTMPNMHLTDKQASNVVTYIMSLKAAP